MKNIRFSNCTASQNLKYTTAPYIKENDVSATKFLEKNTQIFSDEKFANLGRPPIQVTEKTAPPRFRTPLKNLQLILDLPSPEKCEKITTYLLEKCKITSEIKMPRHYDDDDIVTYASEEHGEVKIFTRKVEAYPLYRRQAVDLKTGSALFNLHCIRSENFSVWIHGPDTTGGASEIKVPITCSSNFPQEIKGAAILVRSALGEIFPRQTPKVNLIIEDVSPAIAKTNFKKVNGRWTVTIRFTPNSYPIGSTPAQIKAHYIHFAFHEIYDHVYQNSLAIKNGTRMGSNDDHHRAFFLPSDLEENKCYSAATDVYYEIDDEDERAAFMQNYLGEVNKRIGEFATPENYDAAVAFLEAIQDSHNL